MKTFTINDKQTERADAWFKHHFEIVHGKMECRDIGGAAVKFTFLPTSMGDNVTVECIWCPEDHIGRSVILTDDFDTGDFIFDYDENWNKIKAPWEK